MKLYIFDKTENYKMYPKLVLAQFIKNVMYDPDFLNYYFPFKQSYKI